MDKELEQTFYQRRYASCQQIHENLFNISNHQGMQIKTTMRFHLIPVRMAVIKTARNMWWQGCGEKETLV